MPGPGLDLAGQQELAGVVDVISAGRLSRCGSDDEASAARVSRPESAMAARAGAMHVVAVNAAPGGPHLITAHRGIVV